MFKKYIQDIAKHETNKILLSNYREKLVFEIKQKKDLEQENKILKESLEKQKQRQYETNEFWLSQKYDEELEKLQGIVTNKERIAKELNSMLNKEKRKNKELRQKNQELEIKVSEYYNKFLSEGIKKEKAQQLIREVKKEIDLQGFDQDDFFNPEQTFYRIKNILKES